MAQHYTVKEYDSFTRAKNLPGSSNYFSLPVNTFDQLEQFILANRSAYDTEALDLMSISSRRGIGKVISAKNYVGLITMNNGTKIEILPKIYNAKADNENVTKKIFLDMLKTVKEVPYKTFNVSHLKAEKMNVFEVFIRMFIDEAFALAKRGLKASYISCQDNEKFCRGKLIFSQHIKSNHCHRERFFVEYDIFSTNRPENRLIKSTIEFLQHRTTSARNKKDLSLLTMWFDGIDCSANFENDFSQYVKNRNISEYDSIMKWCRVFLFNQSFTAFAGNEIAYALLFPMEQVFESFVASRIKKKLDKERYSIKIQDRRHHLFDYPAKNFALRPDIVITDKINGSVTVMDTKWKLLSAAFRNYGISQSDMYQMYAYHKKYAAQQVILLYPMSEGVANISGSISFESKDGAKVKVKFIDLLNIDESIKHVLAMI